jgi:hypothetical protein
MVMHVETEPLTPPSVDKRHIAPDGGAVLDPAPVLFAGQPRVVRLRMWCAWALIPLNVA